MEEGIGKLKWQCRRGSLELDLLLKNYLENDYPLASEVEKIRFSEMLAFDDAELMELSKTLYTEQH